MSDQVLVVGVSARSMARSALAAGFDVVSVDGYGDRDLVEPVPPPSVHLTLSPFEPDQVASLVGGQGQSIAYGSNFENHPAAVASLSEGRVLLGNSAAVLEQVRSAERLQEVLLAAGLSVAPVVTGANAIPDTHYLVKPRRSGGGIGVRAWTGVPVSDGELLQQRIDGVPGSLLFLADGKDVIPLALTRQLVGDPLFGATGYRWCGNLIGSTGEDVLPRSGAVMENAVAAAQAITRAFGLRGVNGIDFIARSGCAVVIEVNPRWTGAVEVAERAIGRELFSAHVAACGGKLDAPGHATSRRVVGKAIVFAPGTCTMPDTDVWLANPDIRDVPSSGSVIAAGAPVCTVLAAAGTMAACHSRLAERAEQVLSATIRAEPALALAPVNS